MPASADLRLRFQPLWVPEEPEGVPRCRGCGSEIFGRAWRLSIWLVETGSFTDTDIIVCTDCHDGFEEMERQ